MAGEPISRVPNLCEHSPVAIRVGIDLVSVEVVRESIRDHGDRYLQRIYTDGELADCSSADGIVAPERLAARFAAKEATLKILRPGGEPVPWTLMRIVRHKAGWLGVELSGRAAELASEAGLHDFAVSITHEGDYASAVVAAEVDLRNGAPEPMRKL
jgi:holo-[acyl-carrier protein] synthase